MSWTDERVEVLKKLWIEGRTASQIATELGNVTRNAVIGKVHRLGLSGRPSPIKRKAKKAEPRKAQVRKAAPAQAKKAPVKQQTAVVRPIRPVVTQDIDPLNGGSSMMELKERMCKWPIGDPKSQEFHFCGHKVVDGLPYCEHHAAVAYQTTTARRKKLNEDELAVL